MKNFARGLTKAGIRTAVPDSSRREPEYVTTQLRGVLSSGEDCELILFFFEYGGLTVAGEDTGFVGKNENLLFQGIYDLPECVRCSGTARSGREQGSLFARAPLSPPHDRWESGRGLLAARVTTRRHALRRNGALFCRRLDDVAPRNQRSDRYPLCGRLAERLRITFRARS